uniref:Dehydrogenase/reductase SDR family protein 7-like n=1 Tax=Steinernema glaseri TaxID=37863 RepID=A0A1I7ZD52_9BILA
MDVFWNRALHYLKLFEPYLPYVLAPLGAYGLSRVLPYFIPGPQHQKKLNVKDRTVLITGASTGLGRELAFRFYAHGAKVILTARSIDKLKELCEELKRFGAEKGINNPHEPAFHYLDIAEINGGIDEIVSKAIDGKTIDVLVNNAGLSMRGSCKETPMKIQRQLMEVNFFGHVAVTKALLDSIPDDGAIVVTSSVQGRFAIPYRSAYSASKHALQAFFDSLRSEDRPQLQILVVSAGYMNTGFGKRALRTDGQPMGMDDDNQKSGLSAEEASQKIFQALVSRKTELVLAPFSTRFAIFLRWFSPNLLFWLTHKRGKKQIEAQKKKDAEAATSQEQAEAPSS